MANREDSLFLKLSLPIAIFAVGIFYFVINPSTFAYTPKCPFYTFTGLYCPGCGSQRALHDLLHGNIWAGLQHNFLLLLAIVLIGYKVYWSFRGTTKTTHNLLHNNATPWVILALVIAFWILRNIPLKPFLILAP